MGIIQAGRSMKRVSFKFCSRFAMPLEYVVARSCAPDVACFEQVDSDLLNGQRHAGIIRFIVASAPSKPSN